MMNGKRKIVCSKRKRIGFAAMGAVLLAGGAAGAWFVMQPQHEQQEIQRYTYKGSADASYRVHLLPNDLYAEEWQEEGRVYSEKLTDYIEVSLKADLVGSGDGEITGGTYQIMTVLEGYQGTAETGKKSIYEQRFPMVKGRITVEEGNHAVAEETFPIRPETYRPHMERAEETLGGSTSKDLYLLFEGNFLITAGEEKKETPFSYQFPLPQSSGAAFYEVVKPAAVPLEGKVLGMVTVPGEKKLQTMILISAAGAAGLALILLMGLWTRRPTELELWRSRMAATMRKYGSRMVRVEALPNLREKELCYLGNIESLIIMAEEIRQPVLYCLDQLGMPAEGIFCVPDGRRMYLLQNPAPSTPLVVEECEKGSKEK